MKNWKHTLNVQPYFHNDELNLEQKSKAIILEIKSLRWFEGLYYRQDLEEILEELSDAGEADDVAWFDTCWNAAYDIFDAEDVWVVTK